MSASDQRPAIRAMTASASSGVRQPCSPVFGLRTRSCECAPPRQWMVRMTSRDTSPTSTMMSVTRARRSFWRARIVTPGALQAPAGASARPVKSGAGAADTGKASASRRSAQASTRRSVISQARSSCAAIRRLSGSRQRSGVPPARHREPRLLEVELRHPPSLGFAVFVHALGFPRRLDRHGFYRARGNSAAMAASTREPPKVMQRPMPRPVCARSQRYVERPGGLPA